MELAAGDRPRRISGVQREWLSCPSLCAPKWGPGACPLIPRHSRGGRARRAATPGLKLGAWGPRRWGHPPLPVLLPAASQPGTSPLTKCPMPGPERVARLHGSRYFDPVTSLPCPDFLGHRLFVLPRAHSDRSLLTTQVTSGYRTLSSWVYGTFTSGRMHRVELLSFDHFSVLR